MIWKYNEDTLEGQHKLRFNAAFDNLMQYLKTNVEKAVLSHSQILRRVVSQANLIQSAGYIVTDVYGSSSVPMTRKNQKNSLFEHHLNYTIVYRKYKKKEKRANMVRKITRTAPSTDLSHLEKKCNQIINAMEYQNREVISRVMISDVASQDKMLSRTGDYLTGRTRITVFYR